jgi:type IV pilus assembly protein PilX
MMPRPQTSAAQPPAAPRRPMPRQRGVVLVTSLLLLIVVTILAISMFRSFGLDEKIAGNVREKQRALNAAETAEQYAEYWLASGNAGAAITCTTTAVWTTGQVCSAASVPNFVAVPWQYNGANVGVFYLPSAPTALSPTAATPMPIAASGQGTYYFRPMYYITYLGATGTGNGKIYQIDAAGFGGSADTVAVVESTYLVQSSVSCLGCNQ